MKLRNAFLLAVIALPSCGHFAGDRPLSQVDRDRGPLILDGPDRVRVQRNEQPQEPGMLARACPWKWFN